MRKRLFSAASATVKSEFVREASERGIGAGNLAQNLTAH